mmetsp:Transcript_7895/g.17660  ORF Transcript_7895/g.17660 Transcript_7895/m.17660 type:complete len:89 (+) Transcript_7895:722-988(+)
MGYQSPPLVVPQPLGSARSQRQHEQDVAHDVLHCRQGLGPAGQVVPDSSGTPWISKSLGGGIWESKLCSSSNKFNNNGNKHEHKNATG